jgi:hypothetical protein
MDKEVLNLKEAAEWLDISPQALRKAAARGEVPGRLIARQWRFGRAALQDWLAHASESVRPDHPWMRFAGIFADSPTFAEISASIAAERERQRLEAAAAADAEEVEAAA